MAGAEHHDIAVVGGGMVGSAIAYGLARRGARVVVLDQGDGALRSARVNFGLVWVQSKGDGMPAYARWTRRSADLWGAFAAELAEATGISPEHERRGGLAYCLGEEGFEARRTTILRLHNQAGPEVYGLELLERAALERLMPGVRFGPEVTGAAFCPHDGCANPLRLLRALHAALRRHGAAYRPDAPARAVRPDGEGFTADTPAGPIRAAKLVLAAGHGTPALAGALGLRAPLRAERGQVMVTERVQPCIPLPANGIRQTADGTILLGTTHEDAGMDTGTTLAGEAAIAANAVRVMPGLARARVVRAWAGLRVLSPDGFPVYHRSARFPGAYAAICHSGVTLAAVHANDLAEAILAERLPDTLRPFAPERFDVPQAA
ncbi:FAD-dependent oxidoreductase [Caldovatus sediminis]|uniref:FAD-dependent oxidoreductase n=1 Tax=Caldovatus sediminis TaxID=2041189 RepID=A0A8J2Z9C1_9PROT|nr:FAD-dependent oxidoreductase [Caldovatus sediminis]GGG25230.1 FAD-dependent oxidoreductase [Caldovatus sediminis]